MRVAQLVLTNFRNYERLVWEPQSRLVVLTGENGAGKTNLLEAISLLAPGRGLRGASNAEIQRYDSGLWGVKASLDRGRASARDLATGADPLNPSRRLFRLDGDLLRGQGQIAPHFATIWLTPTMDRLFTDPPSGRRRFLDRLVLALEPDHARESAAHERSLMQRNRLLATRPDQGSWLDALEDSIARHAVALTASRMALIDAMNRVSQGHLTAANHADFPSARLRMACDVAAALSSQPALVVEDWLRLSLRRARGADAERGTTSMGAHRADLHVEDVASVRNASFSSSGQQKAMLIHIILSHATLMAERGGIGPVVLLDEPLNHLDTARRDALLRGLQEREITVFMTGTDRAQFEELGSMADYRRVVSGCLEE